jgi:hypothetical protein
LGTFPNKQKHQQKGHIMAKQYRIVFADQQRNIRYSPFKSTLPLKMAQIAVSRWIEHAPTHIIPIIKPA